MERNNNNKKKNRKEGRIRQNHQQLQQHSLSRNVPSKNPTVGTSLNGGESGETRQFSSYLSIDDGNTTTNSISTNDEDDDDEDTNGVFCKIS